MVMTRDLWPGRRAPSSLGSRRRRTERVRARNLALVVSGPSHPFRKLILAREVVEPGDRGIEVNIDGAGRTVALLADDDLGLAVRGVHLDLPLRVLVGAG